MLYCNLLTSRFQCINTFSTELFFWRPSTRRQYFSTRCFVAWINLTCAPKKIGIVIKHGFLKNRRIDWSQILYEWFSPICAFIYAFWKRSYSECATFWQGNWRFLQVFHRAVCLQRKCCRFCVVTRFHRLYIVFYMLV